MATSRTVWTVSAQLTPSERDALLKAASASYLEDRGLREGSHGEIVAACGLAAETIMRTAMSKISFVIHLGTRWRIFAIPRDGLTYLGIVQHGIAGIGALARTRDGGYVQVNGDVVEVLDARKISRALRMQPAKAAGQPCATQPLDDRLVAASARWPDLVLEAANPPPALACTPVVTVKKRRVAVRTT